MRRRWLRIELGGPDGPRAVLHTMGHRLPHATVVPVAVAARLAARGVPTVVRRAGGARGQRLWGGTTPC